MISGAALAVVGAAYLVENRRYSLDTLAAPGPGVFPIAAGVLLVALACGQVVAAWRDAGATPRAEEPPPEPRTTPFVMIGVLAVYAAAIGWVGFFAATFAVVIVASRLLGAHGWLRPLALATGVVVASYVLFVVWLHVPLPTGLLR